MHRRTVIGALAGTSLAALTGGYTDETAVEAPTAADRAEPTRLDAASTTNRSAEEGGDTDVSFDVTAVSIVECGTTCREATITVTNTGSADATNVRASVTATADETLVWKTDETVGRLPADASVTRTRRLEIDLETALAIRENDRRVTVELLLTSDQRTERFVREEEV